MQPIRLFVAGMTGVALAGCSGLFQKDEPQRSAASQPQQEQAAPQPSAQAGSAPEQASAKKQEPVAVARPVSHQLVRKVQEQLKAEGIDPGPIDGRWGPRTSQAVREFQQSEGIETTAQLDEPTLAALRIGDTQTASADGGNASAGGGTPLGGAQSPFAAADRNNDGALSREEYEEALRTLQAREGQSAGAGGSASSK